MGVRVDHWVTSHGFALNVSNDLSFFDLIVPCGIRGHGVTSLERRTGAPHDVPRVARDAGAALAQVFGWSLTGGDADGLDRPPPTGERILGGVRRVVLG